jgi:hypothetical protein
MKRLIFLLSVVLSLSIGAVSARAHGGCWGSYWGWGHGCYGGGYAPLLSVGICGFGISIGGTYPACGYGYGYGYHPAYAAYPSYPVYASTTYSQPVYQTATTTYSQPVYAARTKTVETQTARTVTPTPIYARTQTTATSVSTHVASARSAQVAPAVAQLSPGAQEVLKLSRAQVGTSVIQSYVQNSHTAYNLKAADIVYLHSNGVSDEVIGSMLATKSAGGVPVSNPRPTTTSVAIN